MGRIFPMYTPIPTLTNLMDINTLPSIYLTVFLLFYFLHTEFIIVHCVGSYKLKDTILNPILEPIITEYVSCLRKQRLAFDWL